MIENKREEDDDDLDEVEEDDYEGDGPGSTGLPVDYPGPTVFARGGVKLKV